VLEVARRVILPLNRSAETVLAKRLFQFNSCYQSISISECVNDAKLFNVCFPTDSIFGETAYLDTLNVLLFS